LCWRVTFKECLNKGICKREYIEMNRNAFYHFREFGEGISAKKRMQTAISGKLDKESRKRKFL
jgi:hypothetical protein